MPRAFVHWLMTFVLVVSFASLLRAQAGVAEQPLGSIKVARVVGEAWKVSKEDGLRVELRYNTTLSQGEIITTGPNSSVLLGLSNGATVLVRADTVLEVEQLSQQPFARGFRINEKLEEPTTSKTRLNLRRGEIMSDVKKLNKEAGSDFTIKTPVGAAGIRGTKFLISFLPSGNRAFYRLAMAEGLIRQSFDSPTRPVDVGINQQVTFGVDYNPVTGEVSGIPDVAEVLDVPSTLSASLQQLILEMMSALENFSIIGTDGTVGTQPGNTGVNAATAQPNGTDEAGVSASPPPTVPPPTTSPTSGKI